MCIYSSQEVDLIADLAGYIPIEFRFEPVIPERLLDSRVGTGVAAGRVPAGGTVELQVSGIGVARVPDEVAAVALNVTVDQAAGAGFVTAWPCGGPRPLASNLNFVAGSTIANMVVATVGDGGKVCLFASNEVDLVADISGFMETEARFVSYVPERVLDTRIGVGGRTGPLVPMETVVLALPADTFGDSLGGSVVLNVTVDQASGPGYVTVWPCGPERPLASNVNYVAGATVPNLVIVGVGADGTVCMAGRADVGGHAGIGCGVRAR